MSVVFIPQIPQRRDGSPAYDVSPAARFGRLTELVGGRTKPFRPQEYVPQIRERLAAFDAQHDSLLLIGSPVIIGIVVCIAVQVSGGRVSMLQWSNGDYVRIEADLAPVPEVWRRAWT